MAPEGYASIILAASSFIVSVAGLIKSIKADRVSRERINGTPVYLSQLIKEVSVLTEIMRLREDNPRAIDTMLKESSDRTRAIPIERAISR